MSEEGKKIIGKELAKMMKLGFKLADIEKEERLDRARAAFQKKSKKEQDEIIGLLDDLQKGPIFDPYSDVPEVQQKEEK